MTHSWPVAIVKGTCVCVLHCTQHSVTSGRVVSGGPTYLRIVSSSSSLLKELAWCFLLLSGPAEG